MNFNIDNIPVLLIKTNDYKAPQYCATRKSLFNRPVSSNFINLNPHIGSVFCKNSFDT